MPSNKTALSRPSLLVALVVFCVCAAMPLWALLGRPPYAFYSLMKLGLTAGAVFGSYIFWKLSPRYLPLCVILLGVGGVHLFGKMHRYEWGTYNWIAVGAFAVAAAITGLLLLLDGKPLSWGASFPNANGTKAASWLKENWVGIVFYGGIAFLFFWNYKPQKPEAEMTPTEKFTAFVTSKEWYGIENNELIILNESGHEVIVTVDYPDERSAKSLGTWKIEDDVLTIHAEGRAGLIDLELQKVKSDAGAFLTPLHTGLISESYVGYEPVDQEKADPY